MIIAACNNRPKNRDIHGRNDSIQARSIRQIERTAKRITAHKFSESFLAAFYADIEKFGPKAIEDTRNKNPAEYVRAAVALLPKQVEDLTPNPFGELTDEEHEQLGRLIEIIQNGEQFARFEAVLSLAPEQAVRLDAFLAPLVAPSL